MTRTTSFGLYAAALVLSAVTLPAAAADAPLADAMEKMDRAAVRTLLQRRADVNAPQVDGMTALHWAAYQDDAESVELLLRPGANVRAANPDGVPPLPAAITNAARARDGAVDDPRPRHAAHARDHQRRQRDGLVNDPATPGSDPDAPRGGLA